MRRRDMDIGPYIILCGPEATRERLRDIVGVTPRVIGRGVIRDYRVAFAKRRWGGVAATLDYCPGGEARGVVYGLRYYQQRRLERRLGYPVGIHRATYEVEVEGAHRMKALAYFVPLSQPRVEPEKNIVEGMEVLYEENGWDKTELSTVQEDTTPRIRRIR